MSLHIREPNALTDLLRAVTDDMRSFGIDCRVSVEVRLPIEVKTGPTSFASHLRVRIGPDGAAVPDIEEQAQRIVDELRQRMNIHRTQPPTSAPHDPSHSTTQDDD